MIVAVAWQRDSRCIAGPIDRTAARGRTHLEIGLRAKCRRCHEAVGALSFCRSDVPVDDLRQHVERHVAATHHRVVERLEIVLRPEGSLRALALAVDLAVADLVATRLSWPRAVAID